MVWHQQMKAGFRGVRKKSGPSMLEKNKELGKVWQRLVSCVVGEVAYLYLLRVFVSFGFVVW